MSFTLRLISVSELSSVRLLYNLIIGSVISVLSGDADIVVTGLSIISSLIIPNNVFNWLLRLSRLAFTLCLFLFL